MSNLITHFFDAHLNYVSSEIFIAFMASLILILDRYTSNISSRISYLLSLATLVIAFFLTLQFWNEPTRIIFNNSFILDRVGTAIKLVLYVYAFFVFLYAKDYLFQRKMAKGEYFVLSLFSILGMSVLISAASFISLYLGLELLALPLYALIAFNKEDKRAPEAAMKYFVMGALASGMLLYGISILYGTTGSLNIGNLNNLNHVGLVQVGLLQNQSSNLSLLLALVFIMVALAFKFGAVPFHMWVPDIYQGSMNSVTLFISTLPELAAFGMVIRLVQGSFVDLNQLWQPLLMIMAILSLALGNIAAIAQTNLKRMLAYSSIGHIGFILLGIIAGPEAGYAAAFAYVIIYSMMALAAFGIIISLSHPGFEAENIKDFKGLGRRQPGIAFLMLLVLFSLAGVPPTVGFYAKFIVLDALLTAHAGNLNGLVPGEHTDMASSTADQLYVNPMLFGEANYLWLATIAVIFSVIAAFYYLRVVKIMFFETEKPSHEKHASGSRSVLNLSGLSLGLLSINGLAMLIFGLYPSPLINFCMSVFK